VNADRIGLGHHGRYCQASNMNGLAWSDDLTHEKAQAAGAALVSKDELLGTQPLKSDDSHHLSRNTDTGWQIILKAAGVHIRVGGRDCPSGA
jgi:hypothetical protein